MSESLVPTEGIDNFMHKNHCLYPPLLLKRSPCVTYCLLLRMRATFGPLTSHLSTFTLALQLQCEQPYKKSELSIMTCNVNLAFVFALFLLHSLREKQGMQRMPSRMRMDWNTPGTKRSSWVVMRGEPGREAPLLWRQSCELKQTQLTSNLT